MAEVFKITSMDDTWKPGDLVLDAKGDLWVRSEHPKWVWDYPGDAGLRDAEGRLYFPEGAVEEDYPARPLTLLVREGSPVVGFQISE
jgi:hypothetical protein